MNIKIGFYFSLLTGFLWLMGCKEEKRVLPCIGIAQEINGKKIYPTVPDFSFINQDSQMITQNSFKDKIYIVDFFFTHCPTICPKVKAQMIRVYEKYKDDSRLMILSHSIDPVRDSVPRLKEYANQLGISSKTWHLVTGNKDEIYAIADDYFSVAKEDPTTPGGFDHSGRLILVDKEKHIRSFCDGTDPAEVDRFMEDIDILLAEQFQK